MIRSTGLRFLIVGTLALCMFIPLFFAGEIVGERAEYQRDTARTIAQEWGGAQTITGPELVIPVIGPITRTVERKTTDPDTGEEVTEQVEITEEGRKASVYLLPEALDVTIATETQVRARGIFRVPVFTADARLVFAFDTGLAEGLIGPGDRLIWEEARLDIGLTSNRALRGAADLTAGDGTALTLEPLVRGEVGGISAETGDPRALGEMTLALGFNGASDLLIAPMGRTTTVEITSDWPHPSFTGAFLPDGSEITDTGFSATWTIPHLARTLPQGARSAGIEAARASAFGFTLFQPNDLYQKAYRAARYGILFIALTFLTVLLIEGRSDKPVHPVQYILVGLAQSVFVLLLAAYAEQIGFTGAYAIAAAATIGLLTLYGALGMKMGRRTWVLAAMLVVLYAVLFLILQSADYALIAGSTLAFAALAGTMILTRNENWYGGGDGPKGDGRTIWDWIVSNEPRPRPAAPPPVPPSPEAAS